MVPAVTGSKAFVAMLGHHPLTGDSPGAVSKPHGDAQMTITVAHITPILALLGGILILIAPRILAYIVAIWLIIYGVLGLWPNLLG